MFNDSCGTNVVTLSLSLEIVHNQFPLVPCLPPSIVMANVVIWFVTSSSSNDMATHKQILEKHYHTSIGFYFLIPI